MRTVPDPTPPASNLVNPPPVSRIQTNRPHLSLLASQPDRRSLVFVLLSRLLFSSPPLLTSLPCRQTRSDQPRLRSKYCACSPTSTTAPGPHDHPDKSACEINRCNADSTFCTTFFCSGELGSLTRPARPATTHQVRILVSNCCPIPGLLHHLLCLFYRPSCPSPSSSSERARQGLG